MIHNDVEDLYFKWLSTLVFPNEEIQRNYIELLNLLHEIRYVWDPNIPLDENRYIDGLNLRESFSYKSKIPSDIVQNSIQGPCNILEMICALGIRIDNDIMATYYTGYDHGYFWIQKMLKNLNILQYDDLNFDEDAIRLKIDNFLHRKYSENGFGGLFYIPNSEKDMRSMNIWDQMCYYIYVNYYEKET